jgi:hypothetical protein
VDTAQAFALEVDNAGRRTPAEDFLPPAVLFTGRSRERRARLYDRLAVALLLMLCAALGCIAVILATPAKADPDVDNVVFAYANTYGPRHPRRAHRHLDVDYWGRADTVPGRAGSCCLCR